ncbi:endolytic transglycosylase MltG [Nonomuraea sp. NPDC050783]|uniref:endolytic transglycosylase MltG n=1 Tax=Nonomuraea sp. NPDC050783 TaxID=3154634 RepID=UPI00346727B2
MNTTPNDPPEDQDLGDMIPFAPADAPATAPAGDSTSAHAGDRAADGPSGGTTEAAAASAPPPAPGTTPARTTPARTTGPAPHSDDHTSTPGGHTPPPATQGENQTPRRWGETPVSRAGDPGHERSEGPVVRAEGPGREEDEGLVAQDDRVVRERDAARPGERRRAVRKAGLVAAGLVAALVAVGAGAIAVLKPYLSPADFTGGGEGTVTVRISPGSSAQAIGSALADAGVVASAQSFVRETENRAVTGRLHPGSYRLRKGMAAAAALDLLLDPVSRIVRRVTVPEGLRTSEVLARLATGAGLPLKELRAVDSALVGLPSYAPGLEGFLFPATYDIEPGDTAVDVLAAMVERFGAAARKVRLAEEAARLNLTPLEVVTTASVIEAEGGRDADYPKIARVIYNRLRRGTPLELDSTVLYAQNRRTLRVTENDTKVNSPYNTYHRRGLPPGPIANPGEKALVAALHPAKGDWHWFVTTDPAHRITKFTDKESEFVRYREELNKNLGTS